MRWRPRETANGAPVGSTPAPAEASTELISTRPLPAVAPERLEAVPTSQLPDRCPCGRGRPSCVLCPNFVAAMDELTAKNTALLGEHERLAHLLQRADWEIRALREELHGEKASAGDPRMVSGVPACTNPPCVAVRDQLRAVTAERNALRGQLMRVQLAGKRALGRARRVEDTPGSGARR